MLRIMIKFSHPSHFGNLSLLFGFALLASSCSTPSVMEVRKPAPGGGFYVERIKVYKQPRPPKQPKPKKSDPIDDGSRWFGDTMTGSPRMKICLGEQKIYFFKGDQLAGISPMSSGREGMETQAGSFRVIEKDLDHKSSLFGDFVGKDGVVIKREVDVRKDRKPAGAIFDAAKMPFFMRITGAIGMHEGYLPGFPASHGCIRLPKKMAETFYHAAKVGTPVEIVP